MLEKMMVQDPKTNPDPEIKDFMENHTESTVSFTITADKERIDSWEKLPKGGLYAKFKLTSNLSSTNMHAFDPENRIAKYERVEDIMKEFYNHRVDFYVRRKALLVQKLEKEQRILSNKARFVEEVCSGALVVSNRKKKDLLNDLQQRGYELFDKTEKVQEKEDEAENEGTEEEASTFSLSKGYEYLLGMKIWSLTYEKAEELRKHLEERTTELEELQATSPSQIWLNDLDAIEIALDERDEGMREAEEKERDGQSNAKKRQTSKTKKAAPASKKSKKKEESDSDLEDDDEFEPKAATKPASRRKPTAAPKQEQLAPKPAAVKNVPQPVAAVPKAASSPKKDDVELTLAARMRMLLSPSKVAEEAPIVSKPASIATELSFSDDDDESRGTKRPSPRGSDSDDDIVDSLGSVAPAKAASKPQAKRTKAAAIKKAAPKKAPAVKGRKQKQPEPESDSEDDFAFDRDVEEVSAPPPARAGGRSARAAAKKVVYALSSDEEGSDSDF